MGRTPGAALALAGLAALAVALVATPLGTGASASQQTLKAASAKPVLRGPRGPRGPRGFRGPRGKRGLRGALGPTGPRGLEGIDGADGPVGPPGPTGVTGLQGQQGEPGPPGVGFGRPGYASSTVDGAGGRPGGLAIGADGLALITYDGGLSLKVARCTDVACTSSTTSTVDTCPTGCQLYSSIAIGADGLGLISYTGFSVEHLRVAHCSNPACSEATLSTLGGPNDFAFQTTSVAIGADGLGLIAFVEPKGLVPKVAHCNNVTCTDATITSFDPQAFVFRDGISVTIGSDGLPLISYQSFGLKVAHCSNFACTAATTATLQSGDLGDWSSISTGSEGLGLVSYFNRETESLMAAHCSNVNCSSATISTLDSGNIGGFTSLAIGSDGLGVISYEAPQTNPGPLKVAHCSNITCSSGSIATVDQTGNLFGTGLTAGVDGLPLVAYHNQTGGVRAVHCSNVFCIPYFQRR
jgi:hypothetical protein